MREELAAWSRFAARRSMRGALNVLPQAVRDQAVRLPFSRFHRFLQAARGLERITWRSTVFEVDPSATDGYLLYFFGVTAACSDVELETIARACERRGTLFFDVGSNVGLL